MTVKQLFRAYKIQSVGGLHRRTGMSRQRCHYIWNQGAIGAGAAEIIHDKIGVPYDLIMAVRNSAKRRKRS